MISIEKIKTLEQKVQRAVEVVTSLRQENTSLHAKNTQLQEKLDQYESRISELEVLIRSFKADQTEIEKGISNALTQLDRLEDEISSSTLNDVPMTVSNDETVQHDSSPSSHEEPDFTINSSSSSNVAEAQHISVAESGALERHSQVLKGDSPGALQDSQIQEEAQDQENSPIQADTQLNQLHGENSTAPEIRSDDDEETKTSTKEPKQFSSTSEKAEAFDDDDQDHGDTSDEVSDEPPDHSDELDIF